MLWLIPYVGWTLAASAVASAAGYAAVTQFSVIQRVLALALQRALSKIAKSEDGISTYNVERTDTGVIATGVVVARAALAAAQFAGTRIAALSIQRLEVDFPSLSSPVTVKVHGVRACMQQLQLPEHISPEVRAASDRAANRDEKQRRLEVVEGLLWGPSSDSNSSSKTSNSRRSWNPAGAYLGRLQARALQKSLAFVAQLLIVEIVDVEIQYTQKGEPGPRPSANYLQGADAAVLNVRELSLMPHVDAVHRYTDIQDAEDGEGPSSETTTPLGSPRRGGAGNAGAAASEEPTWWAALGSLPHLLWSNVVITRPSATKLSVTGVSLALKTYPMLWQGYHAAHPAADQNTGAGASGPFAFTAVKLQSPGNKRRRRGVIIERLDGVAGSEDGSSRPDSAASSPAKAAAGGASTPSPLKGPATKTTTKTKTTTQTARDESWIDYADALRATPAEEHVIFRQWEFSVMLCLLPPGYETIETSNLAPAPASGPTPTASPFSKFGGSAHAQAAHEPGTDEKESNQLQSADSLPGRRPSLGHTLSGFGSAQNLDGDGDVRQLQHIVSGGFEDYDDADPRGDLGLDTLDSSATFASLASTRGSGGGPLHRAGSSLVEIGPEEGEEEFGTPTTSLAASRELSRNSSPERRPSLTKLAAAAAAVTSVDGGASAVIAGLNGSSSEAVAMNGNGKHSAPPPPPFSPSSGETSSSATETTTAGVSATQQEQKVSSASSPAKNSRSPVKDIRSAAHRPDGTGTTTTSTGFAARAAFTIDFAVTLKALILDMNAGSVAIVNRLVDRQMHFSHFGEHWAVRPEVPVSGHEARWWQHGGRALASSTRRLARREVPLGRLELRRAARLEYQSLYAGTHANHRQFAEPGRRWWQLRRVRAADEAARRRLEEFEEALSLEELAHFRFGVAAVYNRVIAEDEGLLHLVADKIDALVYTRRGGMPPGLADLLLHRDRKAKSHSTASGGGGAGVSADGGSATNNSSGLLRHGLRVSISCPKIGIALDMRPSATAPPHPGLKYLVLCVRRVVGELDVDGSINLQVQSLNCGQSATPTGALEPHILSCPSSVCAQICRAADFTRYAVTGNVLADSGVDSNDMCARVGITPRYGTGGVSVVDAEGEGGVLGGVTSAEEWHPAGFNIDVSLAAVGLTYNGTVATTLLKVVSAWDSCRTKPWTWASPLSGAAGAAGSSPSSERGGDAAAAAGVSAGSVAGDTNLWPPPLPPNPITVGDMVENAFATAQEPVLGRLVLPSTRVSVRCPGMALQLPYRHKNSADLFKSSGLKRATRRLREAEVDGDVEVNSSSPAGRRRDAAVVGAAGAAATTTSPIAAVIGAAGGEQDNQPTQHTYGGNLSYTEGADELDSVNDDDSSALVYMFTVTVQNMSFNMDGEDFDLSLRGGTARRIHAHVNLDVFSYLSRASRRVLARHIMPTRVLFDPTHRRFTEEVAGVDALELELREIELAAMAKVWAYPEDMPIIMRGRKSHVGVAGSGGGGLFGQGGADGEGETSRRTPSTGLDAASGLAQIMPELLKSPNQYPIPFLPYLKAGAARANVVQRLTAAPNEPGGAVLAAAATMFGLQAWVSPLHVWHLMSLEVTVRNILKYLLGSSFVENVVAERKAEAAAAQPLTQLPAPRPQRRLLFSLEVMEVSLLWLIGTWTAKGKNASATDASSRYSRAWGITVKKSDPAYLWAQWLAPVYGVSLARIEGAVKLHPNGTIVAGASVDGMIVRDLQLPDGAKHAYVLRPLPARARRLNGWVQNIRRYLLGVTPVSPARIMWNVAFRKIILRRRTSLAHTNALLENPDLSHDRTPSKSVVLGPQLAIWYRSTPPTTPLPNSTVGPPKPQAELRIEVGQMLAYVRVKQQASMTAFAQQLSQIATMITSDTSSNRQSTNTTGGGGANAGASRGGKSHVTNDGPHLQSGLRVDVIIVGIDVLFRVESRDLMALKLQQGVITVDRKAVTTKSGPKDIRLHMSASVQDIMIQDMRAAPEHTLVLIPNANADYCSFDAIYTAQVDSRRYAPCLILEMKNPRIMILFRFVADIMNAVDIIQGAVSGKKTPAEQEGGTGTTAAAAAEAAAEAASASASQPATTSKANGAKPLEVVVQLHNAGLIIPTGTTTRTVLAANLDHAMLAVPGKALPDPLLGEAELPSLDSIVEESLLCNVTYKYGGFRDGAAAGSGGSAEGGAAAAADGGMAQPTTSTNAGPGYANAVPGGASTKRASPQGVSDDITDAPGIKRSGFFNRVQRDRPGGCGVLFFEEDDNNGRSVNQAGVLHVSLSGSLPSSGNLVDNVLAGPASVARQIGTATKRLAEDIVDVFESDVTEFHHLGNHVVLQHTPSGGRPESRESIAGGDAGSSGNAAAGGARPAVPLVQGDADAGGAAGTGGAVLEKLPDPSIALVIEEFTINTGTLVRVPGYFRQSGSPNPRQGSFVPASLVSFSWPSQVYEVVPRSAFLQRANLCMVLFNRQYPSGGALVGGPTPAPAPASTATSQIHISTTPLTFIMSGPNYTTLMDFIRGNLRDLLDRGKDPTAAAMPAAFKETKFNSSMKFGPLSGMAPSFRFTLAVPRLGVVLEAHPREWDDLHPEYDWVSASETHLLKPFFHGSVSNLLMDLGNLPNGDMHINFCATSLDMQDLRMGYRLAEVSAKVPQDGDAGVNTADGVAAAEAGEQPRPLRRWGAKVSDEEERARAALLASTLSPGESSSVYASPAESPRSNSSFESAAADVPVTPTGANTTVQAPGLNFNLASINVFTPETPVVFGSGSSTNAQLGGGRGGGAGTASTPGPVAETVQKPGQQTGIRLSVSRRLSEHSHYRHRAGFVSDGSATPGSAGGGSGGGGTPKHFLPVLDFGELPEVEHTLGEDVASLRILSAPHQAPPEERASTTVSTKIPGSNPNVRLEVSLAMLADDTVAVEIAMSSGLLQWPYFQDLSLIWSIANVFKSATADEREAAGDDVPSVTFHPPAPGPSSWLYLNVILTEMEFFLPVLDVEMAERMAAEVWGDGIAGLGGDGAGGINNIFSAATTPGNTANGSLPYRQQKNSFQRIADLALAAMLLDSTSAPGALALEERGLALSATALRFGYAAGGDGNMVMRIDLRELAAFIRDPIARANCVLQPFSCSVEVNSQVPEAAEHLEMERLDRAATLIQRQWRRYSARQALRTRIESQAHGAIPAVANFVAGTSRKSLNGRGSAAPGSQHEDDYRRSMQWRLVDELVMDVASPHTRSLLESYKRASRDRSQLMFLSQFLTVSTTVVHIKAGALTARAAFSHIPFWQTALDGVNRMVLGVTTSSTPGAVVANPANTPASSIGGGRAPAAPLPRQPSLSNTEPSSGSKTKLNPFRPHSLQVTVALENVAAVLCNDKPETFGAPDVLQLSFCEATLAYDAATMLPDRPANKAARLALSTYASYLNSGTSRWEPLYDLWPISAEFVDIKSPMYLSDRKINLWLSSDRHLNATFNPASLMSLGDALAFMRAFQNQQGLTSSIDDEVPMAQQHSPTARRTVSGNLTAAALEIDGRPKAHATTVSTKGAVTSRAPQKYLIQNQSGMRVYYWASNSSSESKSSATAAAATRTRNSVFTLDNGSSETLRVSPVTKHLNFLHSTSTATGVERMASVIDLHFEGNWMPIRDVAVNVVGKYRYSMVSPADNTFVPLVVDIILVGRTKIITLHSGIWIENSIGRPVSLRLHVPTTPLVPPQSVGGGASAGVGGVGGAPGVVGMHPHVSVEGDLSIGPLAPKVGCYLPLTAALGGRLFLQPEGYMEASRDVIRLSPDVEKLVGQQGYVSCDPVEPRGGGGAAGGHSTAQAAIFYNDGDGDGNGPLHVAMEATPSRVVSEFQAFKHMECVTPGTIQRATTPLEVTISIQPTMVIANALPYEMRVLLWQVPPPETPASPSVADMKASKKKQKLMKKQGPLAEMGSNTSRQKRTPGGDGSSSLPAVTPGTAHHATLLEMLSPRTAPTVPVPRRGNPGQYYCYSVPPGGEQEVHVDLRQNVLMHVSVEEINMRSIKWSLCSWAQRPGRRDGRETQQYAAKLPKEVQLRLLGVGMALPMDHSLISPYLLRLKDAGTMLGTMHRQFHREARTAVNSEDVQAAVGRVKAFAKRMGKVGTSRVQHALGRHGSSNRVGKSESSGAMATGTAGEAVNRRPVPPRPKPPAMAPPPADGGVVKRKSWMLARWSRSRMDPVKLPNEQTGASSSAPAAGAAAPARPDSAQSAATTASTASPNKQLLSTSKPLSDDVTASPLPEKSVEMVSKPAASAATAAAAAAPRRMPPRPPPLEITEAPLDEIRDPASGMVRTPFDVWKQPPAPALKKTESKYSETDEDEHLGTEVRAPPILHVGVHNSLVDQKLEQAGVCRITLYAPFWLNNRTGVDLFYQDYSSAPTYPLLCGSKLPGDFGEVFVPGTSMTELFDTDGSETGASAATSQLGNAAGASKLGAETEHHQALLEYKLVLMNKQESLGLGLGHVRRRKYGSPIPIKTVGNKGTVELRGPAAVAPPSTATKVAQGLMGAAGAVATAGTAVPAAAVTRLQQGLRGTPEKKPAYPTSGTGADVVSTEPGTMLVRLSSATSPRDRTQPRRTSVLRSSSSLGDHHHTTPPKPVDDKEALEAFEAMQQVPAIISSSAPSGGAPGGGGGGGGLDDGGENVGIGGARGEIPSVLPTSKSGRVADDAVFKKDEEQGVPTAELPNETTAAAAGIPEMGTTPSMVMRNKLLQPLEGEEAEQGQQIIEEQVQAGKRTVKISKGQRLFEFAVDVAAAPPDSIYSHTKLVTLKPKYIIENQTGLPVDVKQLQTKNPEEFENGDGSGGVDTGETPSESTRFARTLAPGQRAAVYWDDADLPRELVVRPCPPGDAPGTWHWSGGFPIPDTEWYFGLRIRQAQGERRYMNIPVNVTVGSSGSVQVTLKSPASVPPYRIENACKDVHLFFVQVPMVFREQGNLYVDSLQPGESMPYAWDEPTLVTKLRVQAKVVSRASEGKVSDFVLDRLGDAPMMMLPTHGDHEAAKRTDKAGRIYRTISNDVPDELRKKLVSLLAAEFSKKVYVSVYADGPTRVLRFSDEKNISSLEQQHVVLDLAARLKQVESQLRAVNAQFARLSGVSGSHSWSLDLYGRMPNAKDEAQSQKATLQRRTSRKAPLPEATQALVHYASRHLPAVTTMPRHGRNVSRDFMESPSASVALPPAGGGTTAAGAPGAVVPVPGKEKSGVRFARSVSFADDPAGAGPSRAGPGVLQVQDDEFEATKDGSGATLPYRHLSIHTDTDLAAKVDPSTALQTPSPAGNFFLGDTSKAIGADVSGGASGSGAAGSTTPSTSARLRRGDSRDWGHIMNDPQQGAGTRGLGAKAAGGGGSTGSFSIQGAQGGSTISLPGLAVNASSSSTTNLAAANVARRQELLRLMVDGDAVLLVGGDLTVTVVQAKDLAGIPRSTHPFARIRVQDPIPPPDADERTKQTSVVWQSADPVWDEQLIFRDVCAASELVVELWDLGGTRSSDQLNALSTNPQEVIKSCRYLGRAEVPLGDTLDAPAGTPLWFPLMRRSAADTVSGQLQLRFQWDVTARGLLAIKLAALERVLAQRREILAALHPVHVRTALEWSEPSTVDAAAAIPGEPGSPTKGAAAAAANNAEGAPQGVDLFGLGGEASIGGITSINQPSKVAAEVLARHSLDHSKRHLVVTVLEARGLNPRRGVVVALSASELPNPAVTLTVAGQPPYSTPTISHTLAPRWPADGRHCFKSVDPSSAAVHIKVWDHRRSGMTQRGVTLGQGVIHASHVRGDKPVYVWVPMARPGKGRSSGLPTAPGELDTELQVFLRLQWQTEVERGSSFKMEIDAAGAGLMVVGGLQDELFNLTVDSAKVSAVRTRLELQVEGSIAKVQLDNQMLNAVEPVVLAPDVGVKPAGAAVDGPLLSFEFVRSYAGSAGTGGGTSDIVQAAAAALAEASTNNLASLDNNAVGGDDVSVSATSASASANDLSVFGGEGREGAIANNFESSSHTRSRSFGTGIDGVANATTSVSTAHSDARGIRSFKKIRFTVAPLDLMTDEAFLEALLSFISSLPTADIWQDRAWQEQQRRLLTAQFGPREVEGLAVNAIVVAPQAPPTAVGITPGIAPGSEGLNTGPTTSAVAANNAGAGTNSGGGGFISNHAAAATALSWVIEKEARDLEALHGQSDLSSWFFLESAEVGMISVNVTVSLSSRLIAAGQSLSRGAGTFNRALDASGFQLVNVSNVPITLGRWVAGNDPSIRGRFSNGFLSQRALASNLGRHYYREGLKEAHKVLGGAGPAVASVPLAVLWASGSALMLVREVSTGNAGFVGALQQSIYIPMMSLSLLGAGFSRTFAAGMAAMPPHRDDGDDETLRRIIRRPNNALEALAGAPKELVYGVANAFKGVLMDPVAGWHDMHIFGFTLGLFKAMLGLPVRPLIGGLEFSSKIFAALALSSLGRDGIVGKIQRRVRAPGAYADDSGEAMMEDGPRSEAQAHTRTLQAAWQRALPEFFPEMAGDTVTDVINVRPTRVVLVTDKHVAYLRARHLREHSVYKAKWLVPVSEVQNIRGDPETRKITIVHVHKYDLKLLGVWPVQKRKGMRCGSRATYERTVLRLTKEQQALQSGGGVAGEGAAGNGFVPANIDELTIVSAPYRPPSRMSGPGQSLLLTGRVGTAVRTTSPTGAAGGVGVVQVQQQPTGSQGARPVPFGMGEIRGLPPPPQKIMQ